MPLDKKAAQERLRKFDFAGLLTQELGWDWCKSTLTIPASEQTFTLTAIAEKRGMVAYQCLCPAGVSMPDSGMRRKIEQHVSKAAYEHIIIFTDAARTLQTWQWVKREAGKPAACREHTYHVQQSGEALLQKLDGIAFTLSEEENLTLIDVTSRTRAAFDVERVTKRFYERFKTEHAAFLKFITGVTEKADHEWYASLMLNRLMFVYFVQRKGFLDGDRDYLRNRLALMREEYGKNKFYSFYRYFLLRLFHEGLGGKARSGDLEKLVGKIPYLNGGLFEKHQIEQHYSDIQIPDKAFERIFDFFGDFDWHLDERTLRNDNEINPDVLGYIFEKYINQKQMGAYYTKEDITEYISKNTIIPFLFDSARKAKNAKSFFEGENSIWKLLKADPDRYIYAVVKHGISLPLPPEIERGVDTYQPNLIGRRKGWNNSAPAEYGLPTEIWREVVARRQRCAEIQRKLKAGQVHDINEFITLNLDIGRFAQDVIERCEGPELLRAIWHAVEHVTILDPTCGSGAFLFAALNILEPLYEACLDRMKTFLKDLDHSGEKHRPEKFSDFRKVLQHVAAHPSRRYFIFKSIILNNLFGVDIMEEAVEICKLRLFLKLAAQVEPEPAKYNYGIEPLPDIDFNIRTGNTLVGYATKAEVQRCMKEFGDGQMKLMDEGDLGSFTRFNARCADVEQAFAKFRQLQIEGDGSVPADDKSELHRRLKALEGELHRHLASAYGVKLGDKTAYANWVKSHQPFHWFSQFYGILNNGGFDIIIGNPPYVEVSEIADQYSIRQLSLVETGNLYSICLERFAQLLHSNARLGVIVPISSVSTPRMLPLMQMLQRRFSPLHLSNFAVRPGKLFVGVDMNLTIITGKRSTEEQAPAIFSSAYNRWSEHGRSSLFPNLAYAPAQLLENGAAITKAGSALSMSLFKKMAQHPSLALRRSEAPSADRVYYHSGGRYFRKCIREQLSNEYKPLSVQKGFGDPAVCLLSSSLYYWFWLTISDCYHVTRRDIDLMPVPDSLVTGPEMTELAEGLLKDLWKHAERRLRKRKDGDRQEEVNFHVGMSRPIIDEIDLALARHYRFSDEELDFIMNHDVKYRFEASGQEQE